MEVLLAGFHAEGLLLVTDKHSYVGCMVPQDTVTLVLQCERHFLIMDNSSGIQLYTYEGRQICNPKSQGRSYITIAAATAVCAMHDDDEPCSIEFLTGRYPNP
jgi:hypothetical protein